MRSWKAAKGALVLLAGFGVLGLIHAEHQHMAEELVRHFHLNPASRFPRIFIEATTKANDSTLWLLACAALLNAVLRLVEAFGLWRQRLWAERLGVVSGAVYIPIELCELLRGVTWPNVTLLSVNTICVVFLARALRSHGNRPKMRSSGTVTRCARARPLSLGVRQLRITGFG